MIPAHARTEAAPNVVAACVLPGEARRAPITALDEGQDGLKQTPSFPAGAGRWEFLNECRGGCASPPDRDFGAWVLRRLASRLHSGAGIGTESDGVAIRAAAVAVRGHGNDQAKHLDQRPRS